MLYSWFLPSVNPGQNPGQKRRPKPGQTSGQNLLNNYNKNVENRGKVFEHVFYFWACPLLFLFVQWFFLEFLYTFSLDFIVFSLVFICFSLLFHCFSLFFNICLLAALLTYRRGSVWDFICREQRQFWRGPRSVFLYNSWWSIGAQTFSDQIFGGLYRQVRE